MESHYSINVARREGDGWDGKGFYSHLFATAPRSCITRPDMEKVLAELIPLFPEPAYKISVTYWSAQGRDVNISLKIASSSLREIDA